MRRNVKLKAAAFLVIGAVSGFLAASGRFGLSAAPEDKKMASQKPPQPGGPAYGAPIGGKYIPNPPGKFGGVINLSARDSKPYWPPQVVPPKGAPNVLLIM